MQIKTKRRDERGAEKDNCEQKPNSAQKKGESRKQVRAKDGSKENYKPKREIQKRWMEGKGKEKAHLFTYRSSFQLRNNGW